MLKVVTKLGLILALAWQLSACGFHLRGTDSVGSLPFGQVQLHLANGVQQNIADAMAKQLELSGVQLVSTADTILKLAPTQYQVSRTSTSSLGDASSELIKMSQEFTLTNQMDKILLSGSAVRYQDRRIDSASILAADAELQRIQKRMADDIARQIINRMQRGLTSK